MSRESNHDQEQGSTTSMGNIDKDKFDSLAVLRENAWSSFDRRREFEWKISLAFWSVFAFSIGQLITAKAPIKSMWLVWGTVIVALFVAVLHILWIGLVTTANRMDQNMARYLDDKMLKIANFEYPGTLKAEIEAKKELPKPFKFAAESFQKGVTIILALSTIILVVSVYAGHTDSDCGNCNHPCRVEVDPTANLRSGQ